MSNALKFTEKGYVEVELATRKSSDGALSLSMTVTDTGCGIADEHKERLFEEFEQVNENTAAVFGGTGLGLSIAKGLTEMMGGSISLSDNPAGWAETRRDQPVAAAPWKIGTWRYSCHRRSPRQPASY